YQLQHIQQYNSYAEQYLIKYQTSYFNHHIASLHFSWLYYDAGRLSMPAQQLVSSVIRIDCTPCRGNPDARHIRHPRPVCDNLFLIIPKSETPRSSPWGLAPPTGCRTVLPPVVRPKRPPGHLYHLPVW